MDQHNIVRHVEAHVSNDSAISEVKVLQLNAASRSIGGNNGTAPYLGVAAVFASNNSSSQDDRLAVIKRITDELGSICRIKWVTVTSLPVREDGEADELALQRVFAEHVTQVQSQGSVIHDEVRSSGSSVGDVDNKSSSESSLSETESEDVWARYIAGATSCIFPSFQAGSEPTELTVDISRLQKYASTRSLELPPLILAVWSAVLQGYTLQDDVIFGCRRPDSFKACRVTRHDEMTFNDLINHFRQNKGLTPPEEFLPGFWNTVIDLDIEGIKNNGAEAIVSFKVQTGNTEARLQTLFDSRNTSQLANSIRKVIKTIIDAPDSRVTTTHIVGLEDIPQQDLPAPIPSCTHWAINEQIGKQANAQAVCSWDGTLTFAELGSLSRRLANTLQSTGIGPNTYVAFCFPKSIPAVVTVVAVQMAGAAFVPLDPNAPPARWRDILDSVGASIVLCAPEYAARFEGVVNTTIIVDEEKIRQGDDKAITAETTPDDPSFVIFTSGSTGRPKGIIMPHTMICGLSELGHAAHTGVGPGTRVLNFSAYTFDAGITDILLTLMRGGCACVPSEHERLNDLAGAMTRLKANWVFLTPTIADLLRVEDVPYLKTMLVGGEATSSQLTERWRDAVRLYGVYGPTEASICMANDELGYSPYPNCIGKSLSTGMWVVDPECTSRLVPEGVVGELLIQGPLLATGYLESAGGKALKNWISEASRLPVGIPVEKSYLTGDLVRQYPDGSFEFIGRKDSQVKIHGQRTELGEIETRITAALPTNLRAIVEMGELGLMALMWYADEAHTPVHLVETMTEEHRLLISQLDSSIRLHLPSYMIPAVYLVFGGAPQRTHSGKVDRRQLVAMAEKADLTAWNMSTAPETDSLVADTDMELVLRSLWISVLPVSNVLKHDDFFKLGGDSVAAIRLVALAHDVGISLTVATIFENPRLSEMAEVATIGHSEEVALISPFSMLSDDVAAHIRQQIPEVEDAFPCSALQEGLMAIGAKKPGSYIGRYVYRIPDEVDIDQFKAAWDATVQICDILRTKVLLLDRTTVQVVTNESDWDDEGSLEQVLKTFEDVTMTYGTRLCRFATAHRHFVLLIHHALYDGWTLKKVFDTLEQVYRGLTVAPNQPFASFIKYTQSIDLAAATNFWQTELSGAKGIKFPRQVTTGRPGGFVKSISLKNQQTSATRATIIRAAWAIILARHADTEEVTFGVTVSGRHAPLASVNDIAGPMIATVPVRVLKSSETAGFLESVQRQSINMLPYEQVGLQNIAKMDGLAEACDFDALLVIQPSDILSVGREARKVVEVGDFEESLSQESMDDYDYPIVLQAVLEEYEVKLRFTYDESIHPKLCEALAEQIEHVVSQLLHQESLDSISIAGPWDQIQAKIWNAGENLTRKETLNELVLETMRAQSNGEAIYSTDGSLTYSDLDRLSQNLASQLQSASAIVPIIFSSSNWAVVAMLGVLRSGRTFMPLDPSHPPNRLRALIEQVEANTLITATSMGTDFADLASIISLPLIEHSEVVADQHPADVAYILFTSGSTGQPKGVEVESKAITLSIKNYIEKHDVQSPRFLQFSSYVFDASIYEIFMTLITGGTICVPSESERLGSLPAFVTSAKVTYAMLTPSLVKTLKPEEMPTLESLLLIGEASSPDLIRRWSHLKFLGNGYGPTETCALSVTHTFSSNSSSRTIGTKLHGNCWVVDTDGNSLAPIGCVGELWIEGDALAKGYYNDTERTKAGFLTHAPWTGTTKLYKTGDLVRYNLDGTLEYLGRKDSSQVKLRGQRLELQEIEHVIHASAKVMSVVMLSRRDTGDILIAFFKDTETEEDLAENLVKPLDGVSRAKIAELSEKLASSLPGFMVPSFFVPLKRIPYLTSMKTDRKKLQEIADSLTLEDLTRYSAGSDKTQPVTSNEFELRDLWAKILGIAAEFIGRHESFLHIGGDSISAIHLSALARENGIDLPVSTIFKKAKLVDMAATMVAHVDETTEAIEPFSLIKSLGVPTTAEDLRRECRLQDSEVVLDSFPCTPLQEGLLALGVKVPGSYIAKFVYRLNPEVDLQHFKSAWERVYDSSENQRTRIVKIGNVSLQVIVGEDFEWEPTENLSLAEFLEIAQTMNMSYGAKLSRSTIIHDHGETYFVWTIHHAVFDGWGVSLTLNALRDAYNGVPMAPFTPYNSFVKYASSIDMGKAERYWRDQLEDGRPAEFPPTPVKKTENSTRLIKREIKLRTQQGTSITKGTILRAAWALVLARYGSTDDVCFGATASGRNAPLPGIERMVGTVIGTVPVRIRIDPKKSVADFLHDVQDQALEMVPFEQTGFQTIAKMPGLKFASDVTSLLIVQPEKQVNEMAGAASEIMEAASAADFSVRDTVEGYFTFPIALQCLVQKDHVILDFTYDLDSVSEAKMEALCHHFDTVVQQLVTLNGDVASIRLAGDWDLQRAIEFNADVQKSEFDACLHELVSGWAMSNPDREACYSTEMSLTYAQLETYSTQLAVKLAQVGVGPEVVVPVCFKKSVATVVAMLAVMKAGGAFMPMDPAHPVSRRQKLMTQVGAKHLITSSQDLEADHVIVLTPDKLESLDSNTALESQLDKASHDNTAYILFTSGSTGEPKAIVVGHKEICSSIKSHGKEFRLSPSSRVMNFASYVFDVALSEIFTTLVFGGTVCVPSDTERREGVADFINQAGVDVAMITPSFSTTFTPDAVPRLKTIILGGEAPTKDTLATWQPHLRLLNGYAPAECCIYAITHEYKSTNEVPTILGKGLHTNCWIVEPDDRNKLAPIGTIGELVIAGNTIGRYLDVERTAASFFDKLDWMSGSLQQRCYMSGDLVRYDDAGNIEYISRKDTQVKLRGQRIELGEIEFHVKTLLPEADHIAVEVVRRVRDSLVVFASFESGMPSNPMTRFQTMLVDLKDRLPPFMVPSMFMSLENMPFLSSMKVDRRKLKSLVDDLSLEDYAKLSVKTVSTGPETRQVKRPATERELKLRELWAQILGVEAEGISSDDHFFRIGDSLAALQLAALCRQDNMPITVNQMFENPTLEAMAKVRNDTKGQVSDLTAFELVEPHVIEHVRERLGDVDDIMPCTSWQEGLRSLSLCQPGAYVSTTVYQLGPDVDVERFRRAWEATVKVCSNLRTTFTESSEGKALQVVRKEGEWSPVTISQFISTVSEFADGKPLSTYVLNDHRFALAMHHSIYDHWTLQLIMQTLEDAYEGRPVKQLQSYASFVRHSASLDSGHYWSEQLDGATGMSFPSEASGKMKECEAVLGLTNSTNVTTHILVWAAWALVMARYCESDDICFGTTVSGRLGDVQRIEDVAGPTIATLPVRLRLSLGMSAPDFLRQVQTQASKMIPHEHYGLSKIAKSTPAAKEACDFSSLLVVQPNQIKGCSLMDEVEVIGDLQNYFTQKLVVNYIMSEDKLVIYYAESLHEAVEQLILDLNEVVQQLQGEASIGDIIDRQVSTPQPRPEIVKKESDRDLTALEIKLRLLWASILAIPAADISPHDSFLHIGGDSISAIQLATRARQEGLGLNVASIFRNPRLEDMALSVVVTSEESTALEPFALYGTLSDYTAHEIRKQCNLSKLNTIEDIYPCTPLQEGLLSLSVKQPGSYVAQYVFNIGIDVDRFRAAWEQVVDMSANLRTRILILGEKAVQVVVKEVLQWEEVDDDPKMGYGSPLSRYSVEGTKFVWTVHHAALDGWSMQIILDRLQKIYMRQNPQIGMFSAFIKYVQDVDHTAADDYWDHELRGAKRAAFPSGDAGPTMLPFVRFIPFRKTANRFTIATMVRATWAILLGRYCETDDVCFGTTVSGRQASMHGLDKTSGPMIATVPVRVKLTPQRVEEFLDGVQSQATDMVPFEQQGLQNIARLNSDAQDACRFASLLAIQPTRFSPDTEEELVLDYEETLERSNYYNYPLVVQLKVHSDKLEFDIMYAPNLLTEYRLEAMTRHFENILSQLAVCERLEDVKVAGEWDRQEALRLNQIDLAPVDVCVHHLFEKWASETPDKEAVYSTGGSLSYSELSQRASQVAAYLSELGIGVGSIVPYCFEKSVNAVVSIMGILKAGAAFMPMDPKHPYEYRRNLVTQVGASVVLVSPQTLSVCDGMSEHVVVTGNIPQDVELISPVKTSPSDAAYVLFSSGSTGTAKSIVISHSAIASSLTGHCARFGITSETRMPQIASFVFDVSVSEVISVLAQGATICMPTETERLHGIAAFMEEARCDLAFMTPSYLKNISPDQVPTLKTLLVGGEAVTTEIVETWAQKVTLINAYGPAEASIYSVAYTYHSGDEIAATIGKGVNNATWVVDSDGELTPIGCIGELVLEGPAIATGYLNDQKRTDAVFVPGRLPGLRSFKTGDLVRYHDENLVFLGRRDEQRKLRGQRIELGDIEHKMKQIQSHHAIVDIVGQALIAFVAGNETRDFFRHLSSELLKLLPGYMVPTYYIPLDTMPHLSSGKVDRKMLREKVAAMAPEELVEFAVSQRPPMREPSTDTERRLLRLWVKVLDFEDIGVDDNFYALGGDSIRVVTLMKLVEKEFGVVPTGETVSAMSKAIDGTESALNVDMEISSILRGIGPGIVGKQSDVGSETPPVFLTGATGFLGTQILRQLLQSRRDVVVLVRALSVLQATQRIIKTAKLAGWYTEAMMTSVEVWTGDLAADRLGLDDSQWKRLSTFDVIHNGAVVNWNADYEKLYNPNVRSSVDLMRAILPTGGKMVFVSGGSYEEEDMSTSIGYNQTKFVAQTVAHKLGVAVVKPGIILGTVEEGIANTDDFIWRLVASAAQMGVYPTSEGFILMNDAGAVADSIIKAMGTKEFSNVLEGLPSSVFWEVIRDELPRPCEPVSWDAWLPRAMDDIARTGESHVLWPVQQFLGDVGQTGFEGAPVDQRICDAVRSNVRYLVEVGFMYGDGEKEHGVIGRTKI